MFSDERFAATPDKVTRILALTQCSGGSVLDLCCGPGRLCDDWTGISLTLFTRYSDQPSRIKAVERALLVDKQTAPA